MLSSSTLKYNITVNRSVYAAVFVFLLYLSVILLLLLIFNISYLTLPLYILLLIIAAVGAGKAYRQRYQLKLSDSGRVALIASVNGEQISGVISASSFYNALFISLYLEDNPSDFSPSASSIKTVVVIYRDAVSEPEYRMLARQINFGRD